MRNESHLVISWYDDNLQMFQCTRVPFPLIHGAKTFRIEAIYSEHLKAEEHAFNIRFDNKLINAYGKHAVMTQRIKRPIICHQNGQYYPSITRAAYELQIDRSSLFRHLKGEAGYKTVKGMTFAYLS